MKARKKTLTSWCDYATVEPIEPAEKKGHGESNDGGGLIPEVAAFVL